MHDRDSLLAALRDLGEELERLDGPPVQDAKKAAVLAIVEARLLAVVVVEADRLWLCTRLKRLAENHGLTSHCDAGFPG